MIRHFGRALVALLLLGSAARAAGDAGSLDTLLVPIEPHKPMIRAAALFTLVKPACNAELVQSDSPYPGTWTGRCVAGAPDGDGVFTLHGVSGDLVITATFVHGVAEGHGTIRFSDGARFEGEFRNGLPNGHGTLHYSRGGILDGTFKDDLLDGAVDISRIDGSDLHLVYRDGVADGPATIQWDQSYRTTYAFRDGRLDGKAVTTDGDGDRLEFVFKDGVAAPDAVFVGAGGKRISGVFVASHLNPAFQHHMDYPPSALQAQEFGLVIVNITIAEDGRVARASLGHSSGFSDLDDAAVANVGTWTYLPATIGGQPIHSLRSVNVPFVLQ